MRRKRSDWNAETALRLAARAGKLKRKARAAQLLAGLRAELPPMREHPARALVYVDRELRLSELAFSAMLHQAELGDVRFVQEWNRSDQPLPAVGLSRKVCDQLTCVFSFCNGDFVRLHGNVDIPVDEPELWRRFRCSFLKECRQRKWPLFVAEAYDDCFRVEYFQSEARDFSPHCGGRIRDLTDEEIKAVWATAYACAEAAEIELELDEKLPMWFTLASGFRERDAVAVRALRLETMERFAEKYASVSWRADPDAWFDGEARDKAAAEWFASVNAMCLGPSTPAALAELAAVEPVLPAVRAELVRRSREVREAAASTAPLLRDE